MKNVSGCCMETDADRERQFVRYAQMDAGRLFRKRSMKMWIALTVVFLVMGVMVVSFANSSREVDIIARTIYAEAASDGIWGMKAVASVIANRVMSRDLDPDRVCLQPFQFSCWNNGTPKAYKDTYWDEAQEMALLILDGKFEPTGPWTHYCRIDCHPSWREKMTNQVVIGEQIFGVLDR